MSGNLAPVVKVESKRGFSTRDLLILNQALAGLQIIVSSPRLKDEFVSRTFTEAKNMTGLEIYELIMKADQLSLKDDPGELDINLVMYSSRWSRVVGYTYLQEMTIWVNRRFFSSAKSVASNLFHEMMHQFGFRHTKAFSTSVPYQANKIIEKLWDELVLS